MNETGKTGEIGKRNKRNPRHCWQDNELYDVFQPVIGALAAHVFAVMTRFCYGHEVDVRMGLRELAEEAGVSRNTAQRATLAMQALGMIRIRGGRGRASASYELLDLKEAAQALGAQWDQQRGRCVLNPVQAEKARRRVAESYGCVPVRDATEENSERDAGRGSAVACVPVRDATGCGNAPLVSHVVSQKEGVCVPNRGVPLISKDTKTYTNPSPTPSLPEGGSSHQELSSEEKQSPEIAIETNRVMFECAFTGERLKPPLSETLRNHAEREGIALKAAADAMIGAWREYCELKPLMKFIWGPRKFFAEGHWIAPGWPLDRERMERERSARVGSR